MFKIELRKQNLGILPLKHDYKSYPYIKKQVL